MSPSKSHVQLMSSCINAESLMYHSLVLLCTISDSIFHEVPVIVVNKIVTRGASYDIFDLLNARVRISCVHAAGQ